MMFDSEFKDSVYKNPRKALVGEALSKEEREWLVGPDSRAYAVDPHFCDRTLTALLSEYPVSGAIALHSGIELSSFFSSAILHRCLSKGQSIALGFGMWLNVFFKGQSSETSSTARIEMAMAHLRRGSDSMDNAPISVGPTVTVFKVPIGTMTMYQRVRLQLSARGDDLAAAALSPMKRLVIPPLENGIEFLLVERKENDHMAVERLPEGLAAMLILAMEGCTEAELIDCAHAMGAEGCEGQEIMDELFSDGLLVDNRKP
jgi:hypothetical protein